MKTRRTQQQRREATISKLLDAAIASLAEDGFADSSTNRICRRAGVSQGALFNHFPSRVELLEAVIARISERQLTALASLSALEGLLGSPDGDPGDAPSPRLRGLVEFIRARTRTPEHRAWHEVMVAARTDPSLAERMAEPLQRFEQALLATAAAALLPERPADHPDARRLGLIALSIMHMMDSEAVTVAVYPNPELEAERTAWLTELLARTVAQARAGASAT